MGGQEAREQPSWGHRHARSVVKTPHFCCKGQGFDSWSLRSHMLHGATKSFFKKRVSWVARSHMCHTSCLVGTELLRELMSFHSLKLNFQEI